MRRFRDLGALVLPPTVMTEGGVTPIGYSVNPGGPFNPYNASHQAPFKKAEKYTVFCVTINAAASSCT